MKSTDALLTYYVYHQSVFCGRKMTECILSLSFGGIRLVRFYLDLSSNLKDLID